jgi:hypothetical protein
MANESVFLTADEASSLQAAVGRIVSTGLRVHDAEVEIPAANQGGAEKTVDAPSQDGADPPPPAI